MSGRKGSLWLCLLLCAVILTACGRKDPLKLCETFLQELQSGESCRVTVYSSSGNDNSTAGTRTRYWKNGGNWMQIRDTGDSVFAYMYRDGIYYDNIATAGVENGHILWNVGADRSVSHPWILAFQWDAQKVELLEHNRDKEGIHILLNVTDPIAYLDASADSYTVEFLFRKDGSFSEAHLKAAPEDGNGNTRLLEERIYVSQESAVQSGQQMESAFRSKISPLTGSINGRLITYGGLSLLLPQGYSCREGSAGLLIEKNGIVSGGITHWNIPEEKENWIHSLGLWDALSDASYIAGNWGDKLTASFVNEADPVSMNHYHSFYVNGEILYDLWVDENYISREEAAALNELITVADWNPNNEVEIPLFDLERLPQGFGFVEQDNGRIQITQGNTVIGAVDTYQIPGGGQTAWDPYFRWLGSLGIPDLADESLCYMGGSSLYGNWEMHFESDLPPGQTGNVNRYHTFYVGRKVVWDVWFDLTVIDRAVMNMLLEAVTLQ